ncbi:hypothetical protein WJX72_008670 [[Myrmecia] bisecta]|uniref:Uncharacterized protein n=1 Tax=[Myrmecia] bisecta TaxID=41462 RepID=A0AAW1R837_9CHLO
MVAMDACDTQIAVYNTAPGTLTIAGTSARDLAAQDILMESRRADRERHYHRTIWTKDAHGGPYRKSNAMTGYDPLLQLPDGQSKSVVCGYERAESGPTTNFVGNHMTQGAIDLVQAELMQKPEEGRQPLQLLPRPGISGKGSSVDQTWLRSAAC